MLAVTSTTLALLLLALAAGVSLGWAVDQEVKHRKRGTARAPLTFVVGGLALVVLATSVLLSSTQKTTTAPASTSITLCAALSDISTFNQTHHSSLVQVQQSLTYANQTMAQVSPIPVAVASPVATVRSAGADLLTIVTKWIATVKQTPAQKAQTQVVLNRWKPAQQKLSAWASANCSHPSTKG